MGLPPHIHVNLTVYVYFLAVMLEYAAKCIVYMVTEQWINRKVVKAVLFGHNDYPVFVPQRLNLGAFVLLHELYPAKEASAAVPVDRNDSLSAQDFIMALQKIDLEGALGGSNADETSFIFQTNQLPLSCFTGESRCKPGPSCSNTIQGQTMEDSDPVIFGPQNRSSSTPLFSPMMADPVCYDPDKSELGDILATNRTPDDAEFQSAPEMNDPGENIGALPYEPDNSQQLSTSLVKVPQLSELEVENVIEQPTGVVDLVEDSVSLVISDIADIQSDGLCLDTDTNSLTTPSLVPIPQWRPDAHCELFSLPASDDDDDGDGNGEDSMINSQRHHNSLLQFLPATTDNSGTVSEISRSVSLNNIRTPAPVSVNHNAYQTRTDLPAPAISERASRRKPILRPLNQELGRSSRSTSQSSLSDPDRHANVQEGCSSDSELDYRMDGGRYFRARGRASNAIKTEPSCASLSSILPSQTMQSRPNCFRQHGYPMTTALSPASSFDSERVLAYPHGTVDDAVMSSHSPRAGTSSVRRFDSLDTSDGNSSFRSVPGASSTSSTSRRMERHFRDVDQLELAKVPFTYEQVVYCSNEEFKELRSTPNLTSYQIAAMLDARRRATNRQAAERCRRLKTALRDELSERLSELRLQREQLTRKLIRARQRKQEAKDMFITEQKRILSMLQGPDGDQLKYGDWRVRLTNEDEVVVVAVGR